MSNEVVTATENKNAIVEVKEDYKQIAIDWLEATGNLKKFDKGEQSQFIDICKAYGLNPIKREVYGIKYGTNFNLIVGYEVYIKRAERTGMLNGWKAWVEGSGNNMVAKIVINRKDWAKPFEHEVYFEEYNQNNNMWRTKPRTMLKKVVIAQGFRMCFTEVLGGIPYTADELPDMEQHERDITPKQEEKKLYTKEQAKKLSEVMNSTFEDGSPKFTDSEKDQYREMLISGHFAEALDSALNLIKIKEEQRKSPEPSAEEIENEEGEIVY